MSDIPDAVLMCRGEELLRQTAVMFSTGALTVDKLIERLDVMADTMRVLASTGAGEKRFQRYPRTI